MKSLRLLLLALLFCAAVGCSSTLSNTKFTLDSVPPGIFHHETESPEFHSTTTFDPWTGIEKAIGWAKRVIIPALPGSPSGSIAAPGDAALAASDRRGADRLASIP